MNRRPNPVPDDLDGGRRLARAIIDQTRLPHEFVILDLEKVEEMAEAIQVMRVRGRR